MKNVSLFELDNRVLFMSLLFIYILIAFSTNNLVFTKQFYQNAFGSQLNDVRIESMIASSIKYQWVGYLILPVILFLKMVIIAAIIYTGISFNDYPASYRSTLKIVMIAESMMVLVALSKFCYLLIFNIDNLEELKTFYPMSVISFINTDKLPFYLIYPLQTINVFEAGYWLILILLLKKLIVQPFSKMLQLVASTYGIGMITWILLIIFLQLQLG